MDMIGSGESVPQPRPNRLFNSMLGSAPDKPDQSLVSKDGDGIDSGPRMESREGDAIGEGSGVDVTLSRNHAHHANPVRIAVQATLSPEDPDESWRPRAPNSFSTFVELMFRPRYVL